LIPPLNKDAKAPSFAYEEKIMDFFINELSKPIIRRISGYVGVSLATLGVAAGDVAIITNAIPVLAGIAIDLILSHNNRKK
jgi:hypothetical protein